MKSLRGIPTVITMAVALTLSASTVHATDDGYGNTFNVRESSVRVVGDRCALIHYSVDGWSAGYDADYSMGSAYVEVSGAGSFEIESYDWWDWSQTDWDNLTWRASKRICAKADKALVLRAEFDVFPDTDLYDYDDGYSTVVEDSVRVNYLPVSVKTIDRSGRILVSVRKNGVTWRGVPVNLDGLSTKTSRRGVAAFDKRDLRKGKAKITVGRAPFYESTWVRVR